MKLKTDGTQCNQSTVWYLLQYFLKQRHLFLLPFFFLFFPTVMENGVCSYEYTLLSTRERRLLLSSHTFLMDPCRAAEWRRALSSVRLKMFWVNRRRFRAAEVSHWSEDEHHEGPQELRPPPRPTGHSPLIWKSECRNFAVSLINSSFSYTLTQFTFTSEQDWNQLCDMCVFMFL